MAKVTKKNGQIESLEAADGSWWIVARGGKSVLPDSEDLKSIVGDVRVASTPYPRRFVGYGAIQTVVTAQEILGTDEGSDKPIISDAAVERLAAQ